jgi:hypothetical protein
MKTFGWNRAWSILGMAALCVSSALNTSAQVETQTTTAVGKATIVTKVDRGEVVTVTGNDLIVKMADGSIRHIANVPDSTRVTVDGKQLSIHDLKPGMKLQRTITTTTTPKTITTVQSVTGKVWAINPPLSVILTLEDGNNQQFKIPEGQKFSVDGQMVDAWGVRKGMTITATKIVEVPIVEITQKKRVTGEAAPVVSEAAPLTPPPANAPTNQDMQTKSGTGETAPVTAETVPPTPPPSDVPILVAEGSEEPAPTPAPAQAAAPETASPSSTTWLVGLVGLLIVVGLVVWSMNRKRGAHS